MSDLTLIAILFAGCALSFLLGRVVAHEMALNEADRQFGDWIEHAMKFYQPPRDSKGRFKRRGF